MTATKTSKKSSPKASKASSNGQAPRARKDGLRTAQMRILKALSKSKGPMSKARINAAVAKEFPTAAKFTQWMADPLGSLDAAISVGAEKRCGYPSLLTLGYVKHTELDIDGKSEHVYSITKTGQAAYAKALAEG